MKKLFYLMLIILGSGMAFCSSPYTKSGRGEVNIVPKPADVTINDGFFILNQGTAIVADSGTEVNSVANYMADILRPSTGYVLDVKHEDAESNRIKLRIDKSVKGNEGVYNLVVDKNGVTISAPEPVGLFYGVQSLRQLLPVEIERKSVQEGKEWDIPFVIINDEPSFRYRGLHLDVGRHFFPPSFIKKYIDLLALHKMNVFHWHLTEDQGWRIEIKKYPKLTEVGSVRKETLVGHYGSDKYDGKPYGGFYTQDEVRDIVAYAKERFITVIPEIEMPGHSLAALASYPELGCTGGPYEVATTWGVFPDVYCAGNDQVFTFLEDVLTEVMDMFPSEYIHIGGDECPKIRWKECPKCQARIKNEGLKNEHELQSYFIRRIEKFFNAHGRQIIGWDEILEGGLAPKATVMSWRGEKGGIAAAKQHHDVIMTPGFALYFDHYQADPATQPLAIGGFTNTKTVYNYNPLPKALNEKEAGYILGAQGNVWTEYMKTPEYVEYMAYPRACALAEIDWTPGDKKNWDDFVKRMDVHKKRLKELNVNYFDGPMDAQNPKKQKKK
ncbi:MAG: beta-N-acetylhexosaminidase [Chlorobi bacterium]|nr:beta-N-acetylhexosaminidase [Chlorobiota bacterium]